ncbi:MAG: hypothetical protein JW768_05770 [Chitinispirillaceae bacterium]|nr:hypothetical protein [Chitinispirillaceae bacterium]
MKPLFLCISCSCVLLLLSTCMFHKGAHAIRSERPYIDSVGYHAAQERNANISYVSSDDLISQALNVPECSENRMQPRYFQTIEESYQRYLKLFRPVKKTGLSRLECPWDLIETFRLQVFDRQPFINAMLHTLDLFELSTLDFTVEPHNSDTIHLQVLWARPESSTSRKELAISEGNLTLAVTRHTAALATISTVNTPR